MNKLETEDANQIKQQLRLLAAAGGPGQRPVDLNAPANKFTVWYENGDQGYLCKGSADHLAAAWIIIGQYMMVMHEAIILDVSEPEDRVTVVRCAIG